MKISPFFTLIVVILTYCSKPEQRALNNDDKLNEVSAQKYLDTKKENSKNQVRVYGDLALRRLESEYFSFFDEKNGVDVIESYPGILNYFYRSSKNTEPNNIRPSSCFKIEYYGDDRTIIKEVDLLKENPYLKEESSNIEFKRPDEEYYNYEYNSEVLPDEFFTSMNIDYSGNGYTAVLFRLLSSKNRTVSKSETSVRIYSPKGDSLSSFKVEGKVNSVFTTNDGKFSVLIVNKNFKDQELIVFDLKLSREVYSMKEPPNTYFQYLKKMKNGMVRVVNSKKENTGFYLCFFDLENRAMYHQTFSEKQREMVFKDFSSYERILDRTQFDKESY